jgi:hypothetical protein
VYTGYIGEHKRASERDPQRGVEITVGVGIDIEGQSTEDMKSAWRCKQGISVDNYCKKILSWYYGD